MSSAETHYYNLAAPTDFNDFRAVGTLEPELTHEQYLVRVEVPVAVVADESADVSTIDRHNVIHLIDRDVPDIEQKVGSEVARILMNSHKAVSFDWLPVIVPYGEIKDI